MKKLQFNLSTTVTFGKEESVSCIIKLATDRRLVGGKGGGEGGGGRRRGRGKEKGEGGWGEMAVRVQYLYFQKFSSYYII